MAAINAARAELAAALHAAEEREDIVLRTGADPDLAHEVTQARMALAMQLALVELASSLPERTHRRSRYVRGTHQSAPEMELNRTPEPEPIPALVLHLVASLSAALACVPGSACAAPDSNTNTPTPTEEA